MASRNRNQLPSNLPQLQNLIKRDPDSYKEEFLQQWRHYQSNMDIFKLNPSNASPVLESLVTFISQVAHCYHEDIHEFSQDLVDLLSQYALVMDAELRRAICKALILLRNKDLVSPLNLLELFFKLLRCKDKLLRSTLYTHIVSDIKNINSKHKNNRLNTSLQNFMFGMLKDNNAVAAKMSLDIMIELYHRNIWNDAKTVNVITTACFSKIARVMTTAVRFFLGTDAPQEAKDSDSESEPESATAKKLILATGVNKKSSKKKKKLEKALAMLRKNKKKNKPVSFNFSAIHLINDPQGFAEKLFKQLEKSTEKFEIKMLMFNLISRLVGIHELIVLNFYPFLLRFLQPHQREVTRLLTYAAQACHSLVPPDSVEPLVRAIVNNFVTERNSTEVMAVGINAVREICTRSPLVMTSDLLQDLTAYKTSKNKSVTMAARSLIQLYRTLNPDLLHRKDKGKPIEGAEEHKVKEYGSYNAATYVPGTECLTEESIEQDKEADQGVQNDSSDWETDEEDGDSDGEWVNVSHSSDEEKQVVTEEDKSRQVEKAELISQTRILTDEDFRKIQHGQVIQQVEGKKYAKRKRNNLSGTAVAHSDVVRVEDIEQIYKKAKHDKESRLATVLKGREGRSKFGGPKKRRANDFASTTNKDKLKRKPFMMLSHAKKLRGKKFKRSFKEKQVALRDALLKKQKLTK